MSVSKEARRTDRNLGLVALFLFLLFMGLMGLNRVMQSPQFASYRTVDVLQLTGSGVCFGAAMMGLGIAFLRPRLQNHRLKQAIREADEDEKG